MAETLVFSINDASQVGEARRAAMIFARDAGFDETDTEKAAIIVTELASNLVKHAGGGQIIVQKNHDQTGIEILALDQSAGIKNVGESLRDGFSTAGSAGQGLGAVRRLATAFEIFSQPDRGTIVWCNLQSKISRADSRFTIGALSLPHPNEIECGDNWASRRVDGICQTVVVDGLGHGEQAAFAAQTAIEIFERQTRILSTVELLQLIHQALRSTRGAAAAVVTLDAAANKVRFAGVGNIAGVIVTEDRQRQMVSHNGIIGFEARKMHEFVYDWQPSAILVLHSDGLQTRWNLDDYAGIRLRQPGLIAGLLLRDFNRGTDDVIVVAIKQI